MNETDEDKAKDYDALQRKHVTLGVSLALIWLKEGLDYADPEGGFDMDTIRGMLTVDSIPKIMATAKLD